MASRRMTSSVTLKGSSAGGQNGSTPTGQSSGMITTGTTSEVNGAPPHSGNKSLGNGPGPSISTLMFMKNRMSAFNAKQRRSTRRFSSMPASRKQVLENTYKVEPESTERYRSEAVRQLINNSLKFFLDGMRYEPVSCAKVSKVICEDVKRKLKFNYNCPRFKFVVQTLVAEKQDQGLQVSSRSLVDSKLDSFATASYSQGNLCGVVNVHWIYYE